MNTIEQHFDGKPRVVRDIYDTLLAVAREFGPVEEDAKKTCIHLNRKYAFAGVHLGKSHIVLTVKSNSDIPSLRIRKREQASANRWYCEVRLVSPDDIDNEILGWLRHSYELS
ncbi:MAG TPA: DUF5655 domain-containing protein [Pyrinomonadaceae bacterium]|nr:DUF5655 domain-containing protein [Pyrinomonadaceae bacterium]